MRAVENNINIFGDFERGLLVGNRASRGFTFLLKVKRKSLFVNPQSGFPSTV